MSTIKEIAESKITVMIKPKENVLQSVLKDFITFSMLAFCIYISQSSAWWTFITGLLFLFFLWGEFSSAITKSSTTFETQEHAISYLEGLAK